VPYDLLKRGYDNQLCLDFSSIVVDLMRSRHASEAGVEWTNGDVRDMKDIESKSIDVAFDKGTLDAMIFGSPWSPPDEVTENSGKYMNEVSLSRTNLHLLL
jgi:O-glycosyl hydrolase